MREQHIRFCEEYVHLYRLQKSMGIEHPRVLRQAAMNAGYGAKSWNRRAKEIAADKAGQTLTQRVDVIRYLQELGFIEDSNGRFVEKTTA